MNRNKPIYVDGLAHLCFLPNGRFTGRIIGPESQFCVVGGPDYCLGAHEDAEHHSCCYDNACKFRDLTVFDYDGFGESTLVPRVLQSGGDNCTLSSQNVSYVTDQLVTGAKAEEYIDKFFAPELKGKDCYVCIGNMKISYPEPLNVGSDTA